MTPRPVRVAVIGIGCGSPDHLTLEAVRAIGALDAVVLTDKRAGEDPLVHVRQQMLAEHARPDLTTVVVDDPPRERRADRVGDRSAYERAVADWHHARAQAYADALQPYAGRHVGFLVWGDPAFYDSTLRVLEQVAAELPLEVGVLPGIGAVQLLAARHRLVLHDVGAPITVTTGRRLAQEAARGTDNIVVMLNAGFDAADLPGDWQVWWGANLGTAHESLLTGPVPEVAAAVTAERDRVRAAAGWVMDLYLLRRSRTRSGDTGIVPAG